MCTYPVQPVCTFFLHIPVYIIIDYVHSIVHFTHFFIFILFLPIFIYILVLCFIFFLHCPLSGPVLIYISLLIICCIIEYVTNKRTLNPVCVCLCERESVCVCGVCACVCVSCSQPLSAIICFFKELLCE